MKFKVVLLGSELSSSQNTGIHAIANETRRNGIDTFCIDYLEFFSIEQLKELAEYINNITVEKPIIGINTNFIKNEASFTNLMSFLKPHVLVLGGLNRLLEIDQIKFVDLRGTSREVDFVRLCLQHFNINKEPLKFELENLLHTYTDDDVYPEGVGIPFQISRHCIFNCTFCNSVENRAKRMNWRRIDLMIQQMEQAQQRYKTDKFVCTANTFNDYTERCEEFLSALKSHSNLRRAHFFAFMRFDLLLKQEKIWPLFDDFVRSTYFGIETLDEKDSFFARKGMRKEQRKEDILKVGKSLPKMLKGYGLIHGLPNSTEESTEDTIRWLIESDVVDMVVLSPLTISDQNEDFHASDLSKNPEKFGYRVLSRRKDREKFLSGIVERTQLDWIRTSDNYTSDQAQQFVKNMFSRYNMRPRKGRNHNDGNLLIDGAKSDYFKTYTQLVFNRLRHHV